MLAYSYPVLGIFWTVAMVFLWIVFIIMLFHVFGDIFRSHDMGGLAKAVWLFFVIFLPFIGVLAYVIARGGKMAERTAARKGYGSSYYYDPTNQTRQAYVDMEMRPYV